MNFLLTSFLLVKLEAIAMKDTTITKALEAEKKSLSDKHVH